MHELHLKKLGMPFDLIAIYVKVTKKKYMSHLNHRGVYIQWEEEIKKGKHLR